MVHPSPLGNSPKKEGPVWTAPETKEIVQSLHPVLGCETVTHGEQEMVKLNF